ncbi:hypothetical protein FEP54_04337 [Burkholderia multivorans]|nr:hypothetical protein [Burkholderia multivorans]MDR8925607.1 hypothetical protein [Burkholderia multivorans]MDR8967758.1 hypothetical protein [Burkholderia multivorans]MDR8991644.1 hypothetical protein [Burkholderia multivorans]MDR9022832.1 hypothetical protein [Burkholderia multivorans]
MQAEIQIAKLRFSPFVRPLKLCSRNPTEAFSRLLPCPGQLSGDVIARLALFTKQRGKAKQEWLWDANANENHSQVDCEASPTLPWQGYVRRARCTTGAGHPCPACRRTRTDVGQSALVDDYSNVGLPICRPYATSADCPALRSAPKRDHQPLPLHAQPAFVSIKNKTARPASADRAVFTSAPYSPRTPITPSSTTRYNRRATRTTRTRSDTTRTP